MGSKSIDATFPIRHRRRVAWRGIAGSAMARRDELVAPELAEGGGWCHAGAPDKVEAQF